MKVVQLMKGWLVLILLCAFNYGIGQSLNGQWRGSFNTAGNVVAKEGDTEYVLELDIQGAEVTGFSYSYFNYPEKKYYVICRLQGKYDAADKSIVVNEEERIKGNTPPNWGDCLQTHILTYLKQGNTEKLVGRWRGYIPSSACGTGSTELERKMLTRVAPPKAAPIITKKETPAPAKKTATQSTTTTKPKTVAPPVANKPVAKPSRPVVKNTPKTDTTKNKKVVIPNQQTIAKNTEDSAAKPKKPEAITMSVPGFERRATNILKTIDVPAGEEIKVDLYDNGEIDGDTISVFYNNQLVLSNQRLTDKPLSLKLKLDPTREDNELVMYAENMGSIPPNTALMIAIIEGKRYEVYITSTEKSSGAIRFKKKP
ncbi:MAG: hypothetical protein QM802_08670 [Agriterribacter sp.]